jgi:hypothetical protein
MGGALWRYRTQEEGCTDHSFIQAYANGPMQSTSVVTSVCTSAGRASTHHAHSTRQQTKHAHIMMVAHVINKLLPHTERIRALSCCSRQAESVARTAPVAPPPPPGLATPALVSLS